MWQWIPQIHHCLAKEILPQLHSEATFFYSVAVPSDPRLSHYWKHPFLLTSILQKMLLWKTGMSVRSDNTLVVFRWSSGRSSLVNADVEFLRVWASVPRSKRSHLLWQQMLNSESPAWCQHQYDLWISPTWKGWKLKHKPIQNTIQLLQRVPAGIWCWEKVYHYLQTIVFLLDFISFTQGDLLT